jgi:carboxylesterase type B
MSEYPGQNLVTDSHNRVIVVVVQYRLGAFGSFHDFIRLVLGPVY